LSERFRLVLVGAGRMGRTHARALAASSEVEIACVVEPFDEAAALVDAPRATLDDLPEVDGALVCVPTRLHVEVVTALSRLGLPVLCEKPCGLTTDETRAIAALPTRLQVAYWRRFVPALRLLRERIAAGELGEVAMVRCAQWDEFPPSREFRNPASSGGIVVDMGVHEFDQMRWLTGQEVGRVTGVAAVTATEPVEGDPESVELAVALSGGAVGNVSLTRRYVPGETLRVDVLGADNAVSLDFVAPPGGDETIAAALRAQAEDFARAGGQGATVADALAALDAAERGRDALGL
jgi:myo-inositol 2-dehydrogenase/D-chiro-inositol 1-dehydrogenase